MSLKIENPDVEDLPPSAKLVYLVLQEADGDLTQRDILDRTTLPPRTARDALDDLIEAGVVEKQPNLGGDLRQSLYILREQAERTG